MVFASENLHLTTAYSLPSMPRAILTNRGLVYPNKSLVRSAERFRRSTVLANHVYELIVRCVFLHRTIPIGGIPRAVSKGSDYSLRKCSVLLTILVMMIMLYTIVLRCFIIDISTCVCRGYFCPRDLCLLQRNSCPSL